MSLLLPFRLGEETYALELPDVQEVVEERTIYPLPGGPQTIAGAINFHGRIVPVIDLPLLLGFDSGPRSERLIVLTDQHGPTALRVDQLQPIINLDPEQCTLSQSDSEKDCIRSVINWRERMINLFDLEHFQLQLNDLCSGEGD